MFVHQLVEARKTLDRVSHYEGIDFAYVVFKNKQIIDNKMMELDFIKNISSEVVEYEEQRIKICEEFANKDESGRPIIENDLYLVPEDKQEEFKKIMDELYLKYKKYIDERRQQIEIFNKKMNEESDLNFLKIKKDQIPPQIKTAKDLEDISFMVE